MASENIKQFDKVKEFVAEVWSQRKVIAIIVVCGTAVAVAVSLLLPKYYKSTATLLPRTDQTSIANLSGLSDLASLAGVSVGQVPLEQLFPDIIKSESVLREVIYARYKTGKSDSLMNLIQYMDISEDTELREFEVAVQWLQRELDVSVDRKSSIVTITLLMKEPQLAADVINRIVVELDRFVRTKKTSNASEQRKWIEKRLREVKDELEKSEDRLKRFRLMNRRISDSPDLLLEQDRLARDVQIGTSMYIELNNQYELARIEEIKTVPIVNVLDVARPAATKEKPKRRNIAVVSFLLSFGLGVTYVIGGKKLRPYVAELVAVVGASATKRNRESDVSATGKK